MLKTLVLLVASTLLAVVSASTSLRQLPVTYYPYIEPGFDYFDNDVANVPGATIDDCVTPCSMHADCHAYSWSGFGGGTCWLKKKRDVIVVKADVKSSVLWTEDKTSQVCSAQIDTDFVDNDIANFQNKKVGDCCDLCHTYLGCRAYAWSSDNGGTCWLKSKRGQVINKVGVIAADAYPPDEPIVTPPVDKDTDYFDHDIGNKPSTTYNGCFAHCTATPGCHAFSWSGFAGGTCWLKAMKGTPSVSIGVVSAVVSPWVQDCVWEMPDKDYDDHDIGYTPGIVNSDDCCQICKGTTNCKAYTWSTYQGGTCWLKSAKGSLVPKSGVKSAWIL